jgi:hypothetical protein
MARTKFTMRELRRIAGMGSRALEGYDTMTAASNRGRMLRRKGFVTEVGKDRLGHFVHVLGVKTNSVIKRRR